jgi:hypothetical protein
LQHYVSHGYFEHRTTTSFDAAQYLANYPDLAAAFGSDNLVAARQHYITSGFNEGRTDNHAPVMTVASANVSADAGQTLQASSLFSATDADHDAFSYYLYDNSPAADSGHFSVNGTVIAANTPVAVSAAQLAQTTFTAGAWGASDDLIVWASDNKVISKFGELHVNVRNLDGTTTITINDAAGQYGWTSFRTEQDAQGHVTHQLGLNDGGSSWQNDYDVAGNQSWITKISAFDPANQLVSQVTNNDDGTHTLLANDVANSSAWATFTMTFDTDWNFASIGNVTNDDGTHAPDLGRIWASMDTLAWYPNPNIVSLAPAVSAASDGMPVILDLDGDGVNIVQLGASTASFDMDGDGGREHTAWAGAGDGFLAIDLAADGKSGPDGMIDQSAEIVFTQWSPGASSDMATLREVFDTNHNGQLDLGDVRWNEFRIWQDANGDGVSQPGEVKTLDALGLASIGLEPAGPSQHFSDGSAIHGLAGFTRADGTMGTAADVALAYQIGADQFFAAIQNDWHIT